MKIVGLCAARNEDWVIGLSLRVALSWCDNVVVLVHASTDRTEAIVREIAREYSPRVLVLVDNEPIWDEMRHRQFMLSSARAIGGTHFAIVDADEILTANLLHVIREYVKHCPPGHILELPGYNLRHGLDQFHANGIWGNRRFSLAFADRYDLNWGGDRFHHREPMTSSAGNKLRPWCIVPQGKGGLLHLWGADERRLIAKHAAYRISERLRWPDKPVAQIEAMYSLSTDGDAACPAARWAFAPVPREWWCAYRDWMPYLDLGKVPWQESWCNAMIDLHGIAHFAGLRVQRFPEKVQSTGTV